MSDLDTTAHVYRFILMTTSPAYLLDNTSPKNKENYLTSLCFVFSSASISY